MAIGVLAPTLLAKGIFNHGVLLGGDRRHSMLALCMQIPNAQCTPGWTGMTVCEPLEDLFGVT